MGGAVNFCDKEEPAEYGEIKTLLSTLANFYRAGDFTRSLMDASQQDFEEKFSSNQEQACSQYKIYCCEMHRLILAGLATDNMAAQAA